MSSAEAASKVLYGSSVTRVTHSVSKSGTDQIHTCFRPRRLPSTAVPLHVCLVLQLAEHRPPGWKQGQGCSKQSWDASDASAMVEPDPMTAMWMRMQLVHGSRVHSMQHASCDARQTHQPGASFEALG